MAKINARNYYQLAEVVAERTGKHWRDETRTMMWRDRFALRSDGSILYRSIWTQGEGEERETRRSSAYAVWKKFKTPHVDGISPHDRLVGMLARYGWTVVPEETLRAEQRATREAAAAKRKENLGPVHTNAQWAVLYQQAWDAGMAAGEAARPAPMVVLEHENQLDDQSPVVKVYGPVMDGPCGYAYVKVRPATGSFGKWAARNRGWRTAYNGGLEMTVGAFGQSVERKSRFADAFAQVLSEAGVSAYSYSRMD
jgi:hypothetical protein